MPALNFALIAAICGLVAIGVFAFARHVQAESASFMSGARPAKGKFVGFVPWKEKEPGLSSRVYERPMPQLEFETESGQKVRFVVVSSGNKIFADWAAALEREYPVLYDPTNPSHAQLDAGLDKVFWVLYATVLLMAIPAGGVHDPVAAPLVGIRLKRRGRCRGCDFESSSAARRGPSVQLSFIGLRRCRAWHSLDLSRPPGSVWCWLRDVCEATRRR